MRIKSTMANCGRFVGRNCNWLGQRLRVYALEVGWNIKPVRFLPTIPTIKNFILLSAGGPPPAGSAINLTKSGGHTRLNNWQLQAAASNTPNHLRPPPVTTNQQILLLLRLNCQLRPVVIWPRRWALLCQNEIFSRLSRRLSQIRKSPLRPWWPASVDTPH